jgi:hypothetical protein
VEGVTARVEGLTRWLIDEGQQEEKMKDQYAVWLCDV